MAIVFGLVNLECSGTTFIVHYNNCSVTATITRGAAILWLSSSTFIVGGRNDDDQ